MEVAQQSAPSPRVGGSLGLQERQVSAAEGARPGHEEEAACAALHHRAARLVLPPARHLPRSHIIYPQPQPFRPSCQTCPKSNFIQYCLALHVSRWTLHCRNPTRQYIDMNAGCGFLGSLAITGL